MKKSYLYKKEVPFKYINDYYLIYNSKFLENNEILKDFTNSEPYCTIIIIDGNNLKCGNIFNVEGKRIMASVYLDSKLRSKHYIGTLNQIKDVYKGLNDYYMGSKGKIIILPNEIEVKGNDERTFSEIGIRDDFIIKYYSQKKKKNYTLKY